MEFGIYGLWHYAFRPLRFYGVWVVVFYCSWVCGSLVSLYYVCRELWIYGYRVLWVTCPIGCWVAICYCVSVENLRGMIGLHT